MEYTTEGIILNRDLFLMYGDLIQFGFLVLVFYIVLSFTIKGLGKW